MSSGHLHPQYNLRWPEELKARISESAKAHNRSMNADIVARLEKSFEEAADTNQQLRLAQATTAHIMVAAAKAFGKKGMEWSEIQSNLLEILSEIQGKSET